LHEQRAAWLLPTCLSDSASPTTDQRQSPNNTANGPAELLDGLLGHPVNKADIQYQFSGGREFDGNRDAARVPWSAGIEKRAESGALDRLGSADPSASAGDPTAGTGAMATALRISSIADAWPASDQVDPTALWSFPSEALPPLTAIELLPLADIGRFSSRNFFASSTQSGPTEVDTRISPIVSSNQQFMASNEPTQSDGMQPLDPAWVDPATGQAFEEIRERIQGKSKRFTLYALTLADLRRFFHLPRDVVAGRLGICVTLLKKIARRNGVTHWPYRRLKTLRSKIAAIEADLRIPQVVARSGHELRRQLQSLRTQLGEIQDDGNSRDPS
jgi:hypothetical protein